jgi:hypothetical protein
MADRRSTPCFIRDDEYVSLMVALAFVGVVFAPSSWRRQAAAIGDRFLNSLSQDILCQP